MQSRIAIAALGLLLAAACARAPERGPELARFAVLGPGGERIGSAVLWSGTGEGEVVEELRVRPLDSDDRPAKAGSDRADDLSGGALLETTGEERIRLEGRLRASEEGVEYRARLRVGPNVDEVESVSRGEGVHWRRRKGLAIQESALVGHPVFIAQSLMPTDGTSGSLALWWELSKRLPRRGESPWDGWRALEVFNVRDGRPDTLYQRGLRQSARVKVGGVERDVARWFVATRANGWSLWIDQATGELLAIDNVFGRIVREGFDPPPPTPDPRELPVVEQELRVRAGPVELAGTLSTPRDGEGPFPAIVLVAGSGPIDRDVKPFMLFRDLAHGLGARGVAVLRYDKRGVEESHFLGEERGSTLQDLTADARAWIDALARRPEIDARRIIVLGHSEGAYVAALLARDDPRVGRVVLLAGPVEPLPKIMVAQLHLILEAHGVPDDEIAQAARAQGVLLRRLDARTTPLRDEEELFVWLRSHARHDAEAVLRGVQVPLLAIYGEADLQVPKEQADKLRAIAAETNAPFDVRVLPGLDHLLARDHWHDPPLSGMGLMYDPDRRVDPNVLEVVADWLEQTR